MAGQGEADNDIRELADELLNAMAALRREVRRIAARPWSPGGGSSLDLTGSQVDLMGVVFRRPGVSVNEAAEECGLAANSVSTLVGQLTAMGLLVRTQDKQDRRVQRIYPSQEEAARVSAWIARRTDLMAQAIKELSDGERENLAEGVAILRRLGGTLRTRGALPRA
jgi:DNA-binding MarR family transcriptional regulator